MTDHDDPFHRVERFLVRLTLLLLLLLGMVRVLWPEVKQVYSSLSHTPPAHTTTAPR
jgi:hypothetical protein